jgi:hypothetical protein
MKLKVKPVGKLLKNRHDTHIYSHELGVLDQIKKTMKESFSKRSKCFATFNTYETKVT